MASLVVCIPDLSELLAKNSALADEFNAWHKEFPRSEAYTSPLFWIWRSPAAGSEQPQDLVALNGWVDHLFAYLKKLELYYVDVLESRDKLDRFKLLDLIHGGFARSQALRGEHCPRVLAEHRQLLLIEQKKQSDAWHSPFRQLLQEAMNKAGDHSLQGAAEEMNIDRGTLGDYLSGKRNDLRDETKIKMRNYILRYCPHAKPQIQQLGL